MHSPEVVIRPPSELNALDLRELFAYRGLLLARVRKNIKAQFQDVHLGYAWAVAQPLMIVAVFVWLRKVTSADMNVTLPYPLYIFTGLILWYYFVNSTTAITESARRDAALTKRVHFPQLITPLVPLVQNLFELCVAAVPLMLMMLWYGVYPGWRLVLLPMVLAQCMALAMGAGCALAAWSLKGADLDRVLRQIFYIGLFLSPVLLAPRPSWPWLYYVNPMAGTLLAFRACLFADFPFPVGAWLCALAASLAALLVGLRAFRRAESDFLDEL
jgi:lipopolysaccharide transport system permease protein